MLQTCPACHAENRDTAKFCDQCGAPLHPAVDATGLAAPPDREIVAAAAASTAATQAPAAAIAPRKGSNINWSALLFLIVIVLAIYWIIKPPQQAPGGITAAGGDPMASMEGVQKQIAQHKKTLDKDPLDVEALSAMYTIYSQVNQVEKVRPFVQEALAAWKKKNPKPDDEALKILAGLALASLQARDDEAAADVLIAYHEAQPENLGVIATIGNLYYEMGEEEKAIEWYDKYLAKATPDTQGDDYWNVLVDQATMYLQLAQSDKNNPNYAEALRRLQRATKENPEHWAGWYNLGQAYGAVEDKDKALAAYEEALKRAGDDAELKWQAQNQIALLKGEAPPEPPASLANPHGEMGAGDGMNLPKPPPGTPNPHGEGFGSGASGNPHGEMANPHGEK